MGLEDCINITIVGINRTMEEFSNHCKIIDAKVQLLINEEKRKRIVEKYGISNGNNTIDPNTFEVSVREKVMLLTELIGSPNDSFS